MTVRQVEAGPNWSAQQWRATEKCVMSDSKILSRTIQQLYKETIEKMRKAQATRDLNQTKKEWCRFVVRIVRVPPCSRPRRSCTELVFLDVQTTTEEWMQTQQRVLPISLRLPRSTYVSWASSRLFTYFIILRCNVCPKSENACPREIVLIC